MSQRDDTPREDELLRNYTDDYEGDGEGRVEMNKRYLKEFCEEHGGELEDRRGSLACRFEGPDGYSAEIVVMGESKHTSMEEMGIEENLSPGDIYFYAKTAGPMFRGRISKEQLMGYEDKYLHAGDENSEVTMG